MISWALVVVLRNLNSGTSVLDLFCCCVSSAIFSFFFSKSFNPGIVPCSLSRMLRLEIGAGSSCYAIEKRDKNKESQFGLPDMVFCVL